MKTLALCLSLLVVSGCVPWGAGSTVASRPAFDSRAYVRVAPASVAHVGFLPVAFAPPFRIGAIVHSTLGTVLLVHLRGIGAIDHFEVRMGDEVHVLREVGLTDVETGFVQPFALEPHETSYYIDRALLVRMVSGEPARIRLLTATALREGDFAATCGSLLPGRACPSVRCLIEKAGRLGLGTSVL